MCQFSVCCYAQRLKATTCVEEEAQLILKQDWEDILESQETQDQHQGQSKV